MSNTAKGNEYEELVLQLTGLLANAQNVETVRLEREVALPGKGTTNTVDVLWEFVDVGGRQHRILFECRSYTTNRLNQQAVHSWRSVVDDSTDPEWNTLGVMVTRKGYQSGAQSLAETYGVAILELRAPDEKDTANRFMKYRIDMKVRIPHLDAVGVEAVEVFGDADQLRVWAGDLYIETDGQRQLVADLLFEGELSTIEDPPTAMHPVRREFDPPATLLEGSAPLARIGALTATVGETESEIAPIVVDHTQDLAWMLKDTLRGSRIWFAHDGRFWMTDE